MLRFLVILSFQAVFVCSFGRPRRILLEGLTSINLRAANVAGKIRPTTSKNSNNVIDDLINSILSAFPNVLTPQAAADPEMFVKDPPKFSDSGV